MELPAGEFVHSSESISDPLDLQQHCSRCRALDFDVLIKDLPDFSAEIATVLVLPERVMHIGLLSEKTETSPCPICRFLGSVCEKDTTTANKPYSIWRMQWLYRDPMYNPGRWVCPRSRSIFAVTTNPPRRNRTNDVGGHIHKFFTHRDTDPLSDVLLLEQSRWVDYDLVSSWISKCCGHETCASPMYDKLDRVLVQVINCETMTLEPASPTTKYVALSYVWGSETDTTRSKQMMALPKELPQLIKDAISATKSLGLKFLWIDRYCVSQSNAVLRHEQIMKMDYIYRRAHCTIVSLGDNPSYGLPGVSTPRKSNILNIPSKSIHVLGSLENPKLAIQRSKWWTRAWTFQEAILSRRLLYFTSQQVYFECNSMHACETIDFRRSKNSRIKGPWNHELSQLDSDLTEFHLGSLLEKYRKREMTYYTDTLNAFRGILNQFSFAQIPLRHHFGIPFESPPFTSSAEAGNEVHRDKSMAQSFVTWLCWRASEPIRQHGFPSWSWAGWFPGRDFYAYNKSISFQGRIWIELQDGGIEFLSDFERNGRLELSPQNHSPYIWIETGQAGLEFVNLEQNPTLAPFDMGREYPAYLVVISWGDGSENERFYTDLGSDRLPNRQELKSYSRFAILNVGCSKASGPYIVIGKKNGIMERAGIAYLNARLDEYVEDESSFKTRRGISEEIDVGSIGQVAWMTERIRLG